MQVQQYVMSDKGAVSFTDKQVRVLVDAGLVAVSETIPARLDLTTFVTDDLELEDDKAIALLKEVAKAAPTEVLTRKALES